MKKFRTIAGQRLCTTYPEPHATYRRITRGPVTQGFFVRSSSNFLELTPFAGSASGTSNTAVLPTCGNIPPNAPACRICLSAEDHWPISDPKSSQRQ
ncbi:hypothetical protein CCANI_03215 [Corynebacterium canis]|nr:hypothetical protein CCANI_03215 [Corynebacterium canis]